MELEFLKLQKENIFCEDFIEFKKNNIISFNDNKINVLYAPNGVGKSSFCKTLSGQGDFVLKYNGNLYNNENCNLFHIISDQNSRNIIKGVAKDFLIGDDIAKEFQLKEWLDKKFEIIFKDLKSYYKNILNLSKKSDEKLKWLENKNLIEQIVNPRSHSYSLDLDDFVSTVNNLSYIDIPEYDEEKMNYIMNEKNCSIIQKLINITEITKVDNFSKLEQYNDAISILQKYSDLTDCIICDASDIDTNYLLEQKRMKKEDIVNKLDENMKDILKGIIDKIQDNDSFNIKGQLSNAIVSGNMGIVLTLEKEIQTYIDIYKSLSNNCLFKSLVEEFKTKYNEYIVIQNRELNFTGEDILFIEEFIEKNLNKEISLKREKNKITLTLESEEFLGVDRENLKLSTGEQNFISLAFELLKAKNTTDKIILIDDPISSFDSIFKNKIVYAITKFLSNKNIILLTHNLDLIKLIKFQTGKDFNIYLFNNFENQENGFIEINKREQELMISISDLLDFIRLNKIQPYIKNEKLYVYSLIPFMRGYAKFIGNQNEKEKLSQLMHGYKKDVIDLSEVYFNLFANHLSTNYNVCVEDILDIDVDSIDQIIDSKLYPLLNKVLYNNLIYLYLRLKTEKVLVDRFEININRCQRLSSIINKSFPENKGIENVKKRIFFFSKKTLLNEFNHFEGNVNIFQPAIDISENILNNEKKEIIEMLNNL